MATRAVDKDSGTVAMTHRLDGWRLLVDDALTTAWDNLAAHASEANAFTESWFLRSALKQFDDQGSVQLFTLWHGNQLCGLMPMLAQAQYGRWPMPHVQNWLHHNAFLGAPLVRQGFEHKFWTALLSVLDGLCGQALFAHFNGMPVDARLTEALADVCREQGRRQALVYREDRAFLSSDLSPGSYFEAAVRGKKRKELRRQRNRFAEEGELSFTRQCDDHGLAEWTSEFLALERKGWKGANSSALDCSTQTRFLFCEALAGAARQGRLERLELRLDGKPLAMLVNFLCSPGSFSFKTAFDEEYARYSPGVLLQIKNLALLQRTDISYCDNYAVEGHPMIDSLWTSRRSIGRYSVAIGGLGRRSIFGVLLKAELALSAVHKPVIPLEAAD